MSFGKSLKKLIEKNISKSNLTLDLDLIVSDVSYGGGKQKCEQCKEIQLDSTLSVNENSEFKHKEIFNIANQNFENINNEINESKSNKRTLEDNNEETNSIKKSRNILDKDFEIMKSLRERRQPIKLFGETLDEKFSRLTDLKTSEKNLLDIAGHRNEYLDAIDVANEQILQSFLKQEVKSEQEIVVESTLIIKTKIKKIEQLRHGIDYHLYNLTDNIFFDYITECNFTEKYLKWIIEIWDAKLSGIWPFRSHETNVNNFKNDDRKVRMRQTCSDDLLPIAKTEAKKSMRDSAILQQTRVYIEPLLDLLKKQLIDKDIVKFICQVMILLENGSYMEAMDIYLRLAIGNDAWPIGVTQVGIHSRTGREKIFSQHVAHVLNDETQRKYIQALKRLMTFHEQMFSIII